MAEYVEKDDAIRELEKEPVFSDAWNALREARDRIRKLPPADVVPYSIGPDGTLTVTVPKGTKRIGRILIEEDGTQYGGLFYPDTGGCFLSSMDRGEMDDVALVAHGWEQK